MRATFRSVLVILAVLYPTHALAQRCGAEVREALQRLAITPDDIVKIRILPVVQQNVGGGRLIGWEAWVERKSCDGQTVINMRPSCRVTDTYGRGGCKDG